MAIDSPTNDFGKTAKGAKSAAGFAQKARQFIQVAKVLVKGGAGPAGWAVAATQLLAPLIKKIEKAAAIVGGIIALRILMHIMQLAGLVAGLAFGAISGLPLLLIPVAGPFLYVGWVGFWGYRGFTNPFDTIQLATHPWELITRPLSWLGQRFSNLGTYFKGGTEYIGSGVGNAASTVFYGAANFVTGLGQSLLGGIASTAGNFAGWLGSFAGNAFGAASATLTSSASGIIVLAGKITMLAVGVGGLAVAATNIVQLSTIEGDLAEEHTVPGDNAFFTIAKTAQPTSLAAQGPDVTFTITLTAKTQAINSVGFIDNFRSIKNGAETPLVYTIPPNPCTTPIPANGTCSFTFVFHTLIGVETDSVLLNSVAASVTLADGSIHSDTASVSVPIGAPVSGCPQRWPITGIVSQGPEGGTSHAAGTLSPGDPGYEAIDIGTGADMGRPVYATLNGTINIRQTREAGVDERVAIVPDNCPGLYALVYMHMSDVFPSDGDHVTALQQIGLSGAYRNPLDNSLAPHIHYQFNDSGDRSFPIQTPYIPVDVPRTCNGDCNIPTTAP